MTGPIALEQIRADLAAQRHRNEVARTELARGEQRVRALEQLLELAQVAYGDEVDDAALSERVIEPIHQPVSTELVGVEAIDGMVMVLRATGRKMTLPEIADEMLRRGWSTKAEKPTETLRVALRRDRLNRVVHAGERGYYTLTSDPFVEDDRASSLMLEPVNEEDA